MAHSPKQPRMRSWPFLAIGAALFALLMTVGPIIATSRIDASGSEDRYAGNSAGMLAAREAAVVQLAAATEPAPAIETPDAVPAMAPGPASPALDTADPAVPLVVEEYVPLPPEPIDGGSIATELTLLTGSPADGRSADWRITITNDGHAYLWGVYAYLEGFGPVACTHRQLDVGDSTTCEASMTAWEGEDRAEAWATAWTTLRMVESTAVVSYTVSH